jgi:hypothetical protein
MYVLRTMEADIGYLGFKLHFAAISADASKIEYLCERSPSSRLTLLKVAVSTTALNVPAAKIPVGQRIAGRRERRRWWRRWWRWRRRLQVLNLFGVLRDNSIGRWCHDSFVFFYPVPFEIGKHPGKLNFGKLVHAAIVSVVHKVLNRV